MLIEGAFLKNRKIKQTKAYLVQRCILYDCKKYYAIRKCDPFKRKKESFMNGRESNVKIYAIKLLAPSISIFHLKMHLLHWISTKNVKTKSRNE